MAQVASYADLQSLVREYLVRSSVSDTDIAGWVQGAEARLNYGVEDDAYENPPLRGNLNQTLNTDFVADGEFVAQPADYIEPVYMRDPGMVPPYDGIFVDAVSLPQVAGDKYGQQGSFRYVCPQAGQFQFAPYGTFTLQFLYYSKIPPLAQNSTNKVLDEMPNLYLFGTLLEAYIQYRNDTEAQKYLSQFAGTVRGLNAATTASLYAPGQQAYSGVIPGGYGRYVRG